MKKKTNKATSGGTVLLWVLAVVVTLALAVLQRLTGPTYPVRGSVKLGGETVRFEFQRSHDTAFDARIAVDVPSQKTTGLLRWKRYPTRDQWTIQTMTRDGGSLIGLIPKQPAAGKVMYDVILRGGTGETAMLLREPAIMRFRNAVPDSVLVPHIALMFLSMLFATRAGLEALFRRERIWTHTVTATVLLFVGGLVFGPIVQHCAFGSYWTGWPFGSDLTDNKTAVSMLLWLLAVWRVRKSDKARGWVIAAAAVELLIFSIPHSLLGSEFHYGS